MIIPIGTDARLRRRPIGNWILLGINVLVHVLAIGPTPGAQNSGLDDLALHAAVPALSQYLTYQFLHGDWAHLIGNMIFLWIFGNAVCDRMGSVPYILFYLAGGVFAGVGFSWSQHNPLIGASGSIAAVTTAFLVLYPRVHITLLVWVFFLVTIQVPAMILIVLKIILWDNIIAMQLERGIQSNVGYEAHLAGYLFGFVYTVLLLALRAAPRNQFDLLALFSRWRRRNMLAPVARPASRSVYVEELDSRPLGAIEPTPAEKLRTEVIELVTSGDLDDAAELYQELRKISPNAVLPRTQQLELANHYSHQRKLSRAADAYEAFLAAYPTAADAPATRLWLGMIYRTYLGDPAKAVEHLRIASRELSSTGQRAHAQDELRLAEADLGGGGDPPPG